MDAQGRLTVVLDSEQSGGGAPAMDLAQDVLSQPQGWVGETHAQMALQAAERPRGGAMATHRAAQRQDGTVLAGHILTH